MTMNMWHLNIFTNKTVHATLTDSILFSKIFNDFTEYVNAPNCIYIKTTTKNIGNDFKSIGLIYIKESVLVVKNK